MDDRKLTVIVVPHGDLETRTLEISYGRLKVGLVAAATLFLIVVVLLATWFPIASQASRARALERELSAFELERARVAELARALEDVESQYARVRQLLGADAPSEGTEPLLPPLRDDTLRQNGSPPASGAVLDSWPLATAGFVTRTINEGSSGHPGLDIAVARNTFIRAAGAGVVTYAGDDPVYGLHLIIDHGGGLETLYGHASRLIAASGDHVASRQLVALSGSTGRSTAPHLHFEVRLHGRPVDPLLYVRQP